MKLPSGLKKRRVFVAGGFAVYCGSMLWAVGVAERLHKNFKLAETSCPLWGCIEFRGERVYFIRFSFLRFPGAYEPGQKEGAAADQK